MKQCFLKFLLLFGLCFIFFSTNAQQRILTIGGATQDIFLDHDGSDCITITKKSGTSNYLLFESGEKISVPNLIYLTGGGATNTAVSFSRQGLDAACFCAIQNDFAGQAILKKLNDEKVDTRYVTTIPGHQTAVSFIINSVLGERTIFVYRGASGYLQKSDLPLYAIESSDHLYITSLRGESATLLPIIVEHAHAHNVPVAVNPGSSQLLDETDVFKQALKNIDILIMNSYEAKLFMAALANQNGNNKKLCEGSNFICRTGRGCQDDTAYMINTMIPYENRFFNVRNFFQIILSQGPSIVIISNGSNGVYLATENKILFHPSLDVEVFDSVGAGDGFGSCFVASLLHGDSLEDSLRNGIVNAASVLGQLGAKAGLLTREQIVQRAAEIDKNLLQEFVLYEEESLGKG